MRTDHKFALNHINLGIGDTQFQIDHPGQETLVSVGSSLFVFDLHNFSDRMHFDTQLSRNSRTGFSLRSNDELFFNLIDFFPRLDTSSTGVGSTYAADIQAGILTTGTVTPTTVSNCLEVVTKAMLISILEGNGKRTVGIGTSTLQEKKEIFLNCLTDSSYDRDFRNTSIKPYSVGFNTTHSTISPVFVSRNNNVAIVTTSPAHGLSASYDDWGVVMNLNTGIATSFNTSTSEYPNGVPITIVDSTTFKYVNGGANMNSTAVTGTADVKIGWGGTSINLHLEVG